MYLNLLIGFLVVGIIVGGSYAGWKMFNKKTPVTSKKFDPNAKIGTDSGCPKDQAMYQGTCTDCGMVNMQLQNGTCVCPSNKLEKDGRCTPCTGEYYLKNNQCIKCDGEGRVVIDGKCIDCYASKKRKDYETNTCVPCAPGYIFDTSISGCVKCGEGEEYTGSGVDGKCITCISQGKIYNKDTKKCELCPTDLDNGIRYGIEDNKCVKCSLYSIISDNKCKACELNFYPELNMCKPCPTTATTVDTWKEFGEGIGMSMVCTKEGRELIDNYKT